MKTILIAAAALALLGCATSYYQPYYGRGIGYSEVNVGKNRYEVMFHGSENQDEMQVTRYAIVRAAEVGKQNNFTFFRIVNSKENENVRRIVTYERETNYGHRLPHRRSYWGPDQERVTTRVEKRTVVKLVVDYQNEDCDECLSVSAKLTEALDEKIIHP